MGENRVEVIVGEIEAVRVSYLEVRVVDAGLYRGSPRGLDLFRFDVDPRHLPDADRQVERQFARPASTSTRWLRDDRWAPGSRRTPVRFVT